MGKGGVRNCRGGRGKVCLDEGGQDAWERCQRGKLEVRYLFTSVSIRGSHMQNIIPRAGINSREDDTCFCDAGGAGKQARFY